MVKGQVVNVASGPASVMGSTGAVTNAASTVTSMLGSFGGFGHKPPKPSGVQAIATGDRVVLPPGTQLQFVLSGASAPSGGGVPSAMGTPSGGGGGEAQSAAASNSSSSVSAGGQEVSGAALTANIQEALLGPSKQAAMFVVSPDGGHYAAPAVHGSRELIVIDGVDGPEFDHAAHTWNGEALDFVFSSDGKHSAYVAQSGDDLVEVRDGKTAFTIVSVIPLPNGDKASVPKIDQRLIHNPGHQIGGGGHQCLISPTGAHVAVVAHVGNPSESGGFYMFLDGVKSPAYNFIDGGQVAFVGEKLVYIAQSNEHQWHLVVNDKPGPAYGGLKNLLVNDDSTHYAFIADAGHGWAVGVDGVLGAPRGASSTIWSSRRTAALPTQL